MNVLLLTQFFSTTRGGGEYVFSLIAKNLAKNGHKVWVVTNKIAGEEYKIHENIKLVFVSPTLEYKGGIPPEFWDNARYLINSIIKALGVIKKEKIDIIHSNNFSPALSGSVLSFLTSRPHITSVHDIFSLCGKDYWKLWGKQNDVSKINVLLAPLVEKLVVRWKHDFIHTISEATKDDLIRFGAKKPIYVIHNSIEVGPVNQVEINPLQFVHVGRLVFYKNLEVVIKAINIAKKIEPKIKLIIVGGGPHQKSLEELTKSLRLESNIEFKGYVNTDVKTELIATSNALVFPSLCEGFGLVVLEAFAQNKPALVSDIRPLSDIVSHGDTGYVLNPHDESVWAEHLLKIIKNPHGAVAMGKNGNRSLISFSQESMYQKLLEMYTDVLK